MLEEKFEDEINLADYVRVLFKRKRLVLGFFLGAAIVAGVFSFLTPKVYKIDTSLEIGRIEKATQSTSEQLVENPVQLVGKIEGDVYGVKIREKLQISESEWPEIKAENPKETNLVKKTIESAEPEKAMQILEEGNILISAEHQRKIESQKTLIEEDIKTAEGKIKLTEDDTQRVENKIKPIENDIERIGNKIIFTEEEKNNLEAKIEALEKVLVYEQTPGTQFALFDAKEKLAGKKQEIEDLYLEINSLKRTKEDLKVEINSLMLIIENLNAQINSFQASLEEIRPTEVIKKPTVSKRPVSPRNMLNMAIGGILGLFLGVFLAFGKEWWERSK